MKTLENALRASKEISVVLRLEIQQIHSQLSVIAARRKALLPSQTRYLHPQG